MPEPRRRKRRWSRNEGDIPDAGSASDLALRRRARSSDVIVELDPDFDPHWIATGASRSRPLESLRFRRA